MLLKEFRKKNRYSQCEMANQLTAHAKGMKRDITFSQRAIGNYENDGIIPSPERIEIIESFTEKQVGLPDFYKKKNEASPSVPPMRYNA